MRNRISAGLFLLCIVLFAMGCAAQVRPDIKVVGEDLQFSGDHAFRFERDFVTRFPNRHSGEPASKAAVEYLAEEVGRLGWDCRLDRWEVVNYSRPLELVNTVCRLPGASEQEILLIAHHDIAPTTVEGADNDGAGVAILYHLAEIFAQEGELPYTLVLLFSDGEEYGMLGTQRYAETHPDTGDVLVAISLDNAGRDYYDGTTVSLIGQFRNYGPIWLPLTVRDAAAAAGLWQVHLRAPFDQVTDQAAPMSLMDQGPLVAAGIPGVGLAGRVPPEMGDLHFRLWHDPDDTMAYESADTLEQLGRTAEAVVRQLLLMESFPRDMQPYLYFEGANRILTGAPLYLVFIVFVGIFFAAARFGGKVPWQEKVAGWPAAFAHFSSIWLPLVGSVVLLYAMVWVGLMENYDTYPATTKDPAITSPSWAAVIVYLAGLVLFLIVGRRLARRYMETGKRPDWAQVRSLALFIVGLSGLYLIFRNPFSLLFIVPTLFWLLIRGRRGGGKVLDIILLLLGGLVIYALVYIFGFTVLRINFVFLWFLMNMFSIRLISFKTAALIAAILAAGLTLVVRPAELKRSP